jgi:hypothetical protein
MKYDTIYSSKKNFLDQDNAYIFNSGPLIDDNGGDSDYEDYFFKNALSCYKKA